MVRGDMVAQPGEFSACGSSAGMVRHSIMKLGVFGDDVEDRAALDGADMDGGVRRIEAVLERAFASANRRASAAT